MRFDYQFVERLREYRPLLPVQLISMIASVRTLALVDSGADINVLPYSVGVQLGLNWHEQSSELAIRGARGQGEGYAVLLGLKFGTFPIAEQPFAWLDSDDYPLILGQANFFTDYNICFYFQQLQFEINLSKRRVSA